MFRFLFLLALFSCALAQVRKEGYMGWAWYEVGRDNLVLLAGHGGKVMPSQLPRRHHGCLENGVCVYRQGCTPQTTVCRVTTVMDSYTIQLTNFIATGLRKLGIYPHVIICDISRKLIDLNRPIDIACLGVKECEKFYNSWHGFVEEAIGSIKGVGLVIDVHGQAHKENWTELGYRIKKKELNAENYTEMRTSIHQLQVRSGLSLKELITGRMSMGHFLSEQDYRVVPSGKIPKPDNGGYYSGGYNTETYGSSKNVPGRCTDAIQFEVAKNLRFSGTQELQKIGADFAAAIQQFYEVHNYADSNLTCAAFKASLTKMYIFFLAFVMWFNFT